MKTLQLHKETVLQEKCELLASLIAAMRVTSAVATEQQRAYLETVVGAAIWYLPKPANAWTGCISVAALKAYHPASGVERPRLSEEHVYPRKVAARLLLNDDALTAALLLERFRSTFGRVHLITPEENKLVQPHQRVGHFSTPEAAYLAAGVELIRITEEHLRAVKRRDEEVIDRCLASSKGA